MPIFYSQDHPLGFSGHIARATGSAAVELPLDTVDGLPNPLPGGDYIYAVLSAGNDQELIRVNSINRAAKTVAVTRGIFGGPLVLPQGAGIDVANDRRTIVEAIQIHGGGGGDGDGLTRTQILALIKGFARAGSTDKIQFSDLESTAELNEADTRNFDSQRFVVSDGAGTVDGFLEGSDLRGELQGADVPENRKVPPGGTTGQALKKRSDTDYEVSWQDDDAGSAGLTEDQAAELESAKDFEAGMRQDVELAASQTIRQAASRAAERFTGGKALPAQEPDDEVVWTVGAHTRRIKGSELRAKPTASNGAQLSTSNAVDWTPAQGGSTYYLAREAGGQLLFASADIGDFTTGVTYSRIDLEPSARQSSNALVPTAKIPAIDYNSLQNRPTIPAAVPEVRQVPAVTVSNAEEVLKVNDQGTPAFAMQTAEDVNVDTSNFDDVLESTATDVQRAFDELDGHTHPASKITVDTTTLGDHIPRTANTVLKALKAVNDLTITTSTTGLDRTAVEARIRALVAAWALAGNSALLPDGKLNPDLQLLIRNIVTGGWRPDAAITVSQRIQGAAFTLATARTQTYRSEYDPPGPRQDNVNIAVRIARTLFDTIPTAADSSKVRVRLDSNAAVVALLSAGTHLGSGPSDDDDSFDYYNLPIPDLPADSIAHPELDAPTELENVSIPRESIVGLPAGSTAGVRTLLDGNITGLSVQALNALKNGNATPFSPAFSIAADGDHANGIFEVSIRASIGTSSDTLSFDNDDTVTTRTVSGIVTASDLRAQAVFSRAGAVEGIRAARVPVYAVSSNVYTEVGHLNLYLVRDASNEVSYLFDYRPNGVHSETGNAAFGAHLVVAFQRQDPGEEAAAGVTTFTGLTDTPSAFGANAGRPAVVNAGNSALEFAQLGESGLASNAVTNAKLAANSVSAIKLRDDAVTSGKIQDGAVTAAKIPNNTISLSKLAAAIIARMLPTGGTDGQIPTRVGTTGVAWEDAPEGGEGGATVSGVLSRDSLTAAVTLANPTANGVVESAWVDIFSHTVTAAEGRRNYMHVGASIYAQLTLGTAGDATTSPDRGGDRPLLIIQLIKGTEEQGRNYRYFRFTGGIPLDAILSETISVAAGDVIKVRAQMSRLTAAAASLGASVTTDSHWERFSGAIVADADDSGGGATTFAALTDTPSAYGTNAGRPVLVNTANTALVFGQLTAAGLANDAVTSAKIAAGAVSANELATNAVIAAKIQAGAVTEAKIGSGAVTRAKIGAGAVGTAQIGANAVSTNQVLNGAVTASKLGSNAVETAKIRDGAVTSAKLAAGVGGANITRIDTASTVLSGSTRAVAITGYTMLIFFCHFKASGEPADLVNRVVPTSVIAALTGADTAIPTPAGTNHASVARMNLNQVGNDACGIDVGKTVNGRLRYQYFGGPGHSIEIYGIG